MKTGWPPGLLQDDSRKLSDWFASRIDARWTVRQVCQEIKTKRKPMTETIKNNTIATINEWFNRARPNPDQKAFDVQLGCHFEEIAEMVKEMVFVSTEGDGSVTGVDTNLYFVLHDAAERLKGGECTVEILDRKEMVDALADQIVTAVGVGNHAHMNVPLAVERVDDSNWSKFKEGYPVFMDNGKIAKNPDTYVKADLKGCY